MFNAIARFFQPKPVSRDTMANDERDVAALRCEVTALTQRLQTSERALRERTERLYELEQHYSSEHFVLQRSMRDLQTERMRNAGAYAGFATTLERAGRLQTRISELKERLRRYETVDDALFDSEPIVIEDIP